MVCDLWFMVCGLWFWGWSSGFESKGLVGWRIRGARRLDGVADVELLGLDPLARPHLVWSSGLTRSDGAVESLEQPHGGVRGVCYLQIGRVS